MVKSKRPVLHKESRPMFNSNQAFLIGAKVENSPKGCNKKKTFQSAPSY
jgi:hypothetical protein